MSPADPYAVIAQVMRAHSKPEREPRRSVPTRRSATASPPAPAARPGERWADRLAASLGDRQRRGSPTATSRSRAPRAPRCSTSSARRCSWSPTWSRSSAGSTTCCFSVRPDPARYAAQPRRDRPPPARGAARGADRDRDRARAAGRSSSWARGPRRGSSAASSRFNAATRTIAETHGLALPRGRRSPRPRRARQLRRRRAAPVGARPPAGRGRVRPAARDPRPSGATHEPTRSHSTSTGSRPGSP